MNFHRATECGVSARFQVVHLRLEQFVPQDHPLRKTRPLVDAERIRQVSKELYSDIGRPSIPPEQLFLAMLGA